MEKMNKQLWTALFKDAGIDDQKMARWHTLFEERAPQEHQRFLEWLAILPDENSAIRKKSRSDSL